MREAIGGTWITGLVITFMLIFVAFLAIAINYTKAFQMKNDVLTVIEEREGLTHEAISLINNFLKKNHYNAQRSCTIGEGSYGSTSLDSNTVESVTNGKKYYYCVEKINSSTGRDNERKITYNVTLFLSFTLPVLGDFSGFYVNGQTIQIPFSSDGLIAKKI